MLSLWTPELEPLPIFYDHIRFRLSALRIINFLVIVLLLTSETIHIIKKNIYCQIHVHFIFDKNSDTIYSPLLIIKQIQELQISALIGIFEIRTGIKRAYRLRQRYRILKIIPLIRTKSSSLVGPRLVLHRSVRIPEIFFFIKKKTPLLKVKSQMFHEI